MQNGVMSAFPLKEKKVLLWADKDACIAEPTLKEKKKKEDWIPHDLFWHFCTALLFFSQMNQMTFVFH